MMSMQNFHEIVSKKFPKNFRFTNRIFGFDNLPTPFYTLRIHQSIVTIRPRPFLALTITGLVGSIGNMAASNL